MTAQAFGRAMKRARPDVGEAQRTVGGRQVKCYTGIGLKGGDDPDGWTTDTTDTTDSTNCFFFGETPQKQDKEGQEGGHKKQIKQNGSNGSNRSSGLYRDGPPPEEDPQTVAGFFAKPPGWLPQQLEVYRENPARHLKPLCAAVAAVVLGDDARASEVQEEVERELAR